MKSYRRFDYKDWEGLLTGERMSVKSEGESGFESPPPDKAAVKRLK